MTQSYLFEHETATVETTCPNRLTGEEEDESSKGGPWQENPRYLGHAIATSTATATVWVTETSTVGLSVTKGLGELYTSTTTAMTSPVVTQFVTSRTTATEGTVEVSSGVVASLLAVVFVGSLLWLVTFWRGKSAFRIFCVLSPTFAPSVVIFWLKPQLQALRLGWASSNALLSTVAVTSFLAAMLLVLDVTGVTTLIHELVRVLRRWRNADGWRFGWGWTQDQPHAADARPQAVCADQVPTCRLATAGDVLPGLRPRYGRYV